MEKQVQNTFAPHHIAFVAVVRKQKTAASASLQLQGLRIHFFLYYLILYLLMQEVVAFIYELYDLCLGTSADGL